jgi:hypothetical protein
MILASRAPSPKPSDIALCTDDSELTAMASLDADDSTSTFDTDTICKDEDSSTKTARATTPLSLIELTFPPNRLRDGRPLYIR